MWVCRVDNAGPSKMGEIIRGFLCWVVAILLRNDWDSNTSRSFRVQVKFHMQLPFFSVRCSFLSHHVAWCCRLIPEHDPEHSFDAFAKGYKCPVDPKWDRICNHVNWFKTHLELKTMYDIKVASLYKFSGALDSSDRNASQALLYFCLSCLP